MDNTGIRFAVRVNRCLVIDPDPQNMSSRLDRVGNWLGSGVDIYSNSSSVWRSSVLMETGREKWGRWEGEAWEGPRSTGVEEGYDMEPWILDPKLIVQHHLKNRLFYDFTNIFGTTHPNSAIDSLWLTQPRGSIPPSSSQVIDQATFPLYPIFSHDESLCFVLLLIFLFWFIIWFVMLLPMLYEAELSGTFSSDSLLRNRLLILTMLL